MIKCNLNIWKAELENEDNSTDIQKNCFGDEEIYDNRPSLKILNKAITNTLQLDDRNRHTNKEINWYVIRMKKNISTTLFCIVHHTNKMGITVHTYNSHI